MTATIIRSEYKEWYIEAIFCPEIEKWMAYLFDQEENRTVTLSCCQDEVFFTPEEALAFAQAHVDFKIEEKETINHFSTLIDEMLAKGYSPYKILWGLGGAIHKKRNELGINAEELQDHLCDAAIQAPGWEE